MESYNKTELVLGKENPHKGKVHRILAHSYAVYFILFLVGVCLDVIFSARGGSVFGGKIFANSVMVPVGLFFLVLATVIIIWAQRTGRDLKKVPEVKTKHFCQGPYCYTRSPTHWGLFFLILGFGIIANAVFVILSTLISFLVTKFIFLEKEEAVLAEKYGAPYLEYKRVVKF